MGPVCVPEFAVQTMTEGILEHSGRKNMSNDAIKDYVESVNDMGNQVMTDIMLGLPGETKDNFVESMKKVVDFGFQRASVADIRLLKGSVMEEVDYREQYGIGLKVVEYEECIRKTNTMSEDDFFELRLFNANFFLLYYVEFGRPLLDFSQNHGYNPIDLISDVSKTTSKDKYPLLSKYIEEFNEVSNAEWFDSIKEADEHYLKPDVLNKIMKDGFPKLNYEFAALLITNIDLRKEYLCWVGENINNNLPDIEPIIDELVQFCIHRVFRLPIAENKNRVEMDLSKDSLEIVNKYIFDYRNNSTTVSEDKRIWREGEEGFRPLDSLVDKSGIKSSLLSEIKLDTKVIINFDVDQKKSHWLIEEINNNDGDANLSLAVQIVLQKNQKAFLRSWSH